MRTQRYTSKMIATKIAQFILRTHALPAGQLIVVGRSRSTHAMQHHRDGAAQELFP